MRLYNKFLPALAAIGLASCVKDFVPPEVDVEQPIDMAQYEYLNAYSPLKEYLADGTTFRLGAGMAYGDLDQQGSNEKRGLILSLATSNFNEWVAGNEMKYGSVVANNGTMNFTTVRNFVNLAREQGVDMQDITLTYNVSAKFVLNYE